MFRTETGLCEKKWPKKGLKTGLRALDRVLGIGGGIITLRCRSTEWLSWLASNIVVRNHLPGSATLYVHCVDYYRRYWTVDLDLINRTAKSLGSDVGPIMEDVHFIRMFSRDCAEDDGNWEKIYGFGREVGLAVLDSASELYECRGRRREGYQPMKGRPYTIGRFSRLCMMNDCHGVVLDNSGGRIHPYLGEISSVILSFFFRGRVLASIIKHPCMASTTVEVTSDSRPSLRSWLT